MIWKDNRIQTNQANLVLPDNKVASNKIARNRNVNVNSVSAKNKVANRAVAVVNRAVVASKADDKPGYLEKKAAGGDSRCFLPSPLESTAIALRYLLTIVLRESSPFPATATAVAPCPRGRFSLARSCCGDCRVFLAFADFGVRASVGFARCSARLFLWISLSAGFRYFRDTRADVAVTNSKSASGAGELSELGV